MRQNQRKAKRKRREVVRRFSSLADLEQTRGTLSRRPIRRSGILEKRTAGAMDKSTLRPTREAFLAGTALLAATPVMAQGKSELSALEAVLHRPARHKQVIAAVKLDHGAPLRHA